MRVYLYVILSFFLRLPAFAPIEKELARKLVERAAGLERADVKIEATRAGFLGGHMRRATIDLYGLVVGGGLRLEKFTAVAEGLRIFPVLTFIRGKSRIRGADEVRWTFTITAADLEKFILSKSPLMNGVRVKITPGRVEVARASGLTAALAGIAEPIFLAGSLDVVGADIHLDLHEVRAFGISPGRFVRPLLVLVNPVIRAVDLNRMLKKVSVDALEGLSLHNTFDEIKILDGYAEVHSELLITGPKKEGAEKAAAGA